MAELELRIFVCSCARSQGHLSNANIMGSLDYKLDFVWTLWISFVDYNFVTYLATPEGPDKIIGDFDQCARMTEAALEPGCDVDNAMRYGTIRPTTLLFDLAGRWPLGMVKFPAFVKALRYLIANGYDMEERNLEGDTPLLLATKVYEPHAVTCIKAFIEAGSDIHAINITGQGALHCVLVAPDGVSLSVTAFQTLSSTGTLQNSKLIGSIPPTTITGVLKNTILKATTMRATITIIVSSNILFSTAMDPKRQRVTVPQMS